MRTAGWQVKRCIYVWINPASVHLNPSREKYDRGFSQEHPLPITLIAALCKHTVHTSFNCKHMMGLNLQEPKQNPPAPALSHMLGCAYAVWRCRVSDFPSVNSLTPGYDMTNEASQATAAANLLYQHVSSSAAGWGACGYSQLISAPGHTRPLHCGELPRPNQVNHGWPQVKDGPACCHANYCHSGVRPTTGSGIFTNQCHPSTWTDVQKWPEASSLSFHSSGRWWVVHCSSQNASLPWGKRVTFSEKQTERSGLVQEFTQDSIIFLS